MIFERSTFDAYNELFENILELPMLCVDLRHAVCSSKFDKRILRLARILRLTFVNDPGFSLKP